MNFKSKVAFFYSNFSGNVVVITEKETKNPQLYASAVNIMVASFFPQEHVVFTVLKIIG